MRSEWQAWSWVLASSTPFNLLIFSSWLNGQHSVSSTACVFIDIKEILLKITTKKNWKRKKTKLKTGHATRNWRSKMQQENESWKINYQGAYRISVGFIFSFATAHEGSDPPHPWQSQSWPLALTTAGEWQSQGMNPLGNKQSKRTHLPK